MGVKWDVNVWNKDWNTVRWWICTIVVVVENVKFVVWLLFAVCLVLWSSVSWACRYNLVFLQEREIRNITGFPSCRFRTNLVGLEQKTNFDFRFRQLNRCCESSFGSLLSVGALNERHSILEGAIASQECSAGLGSVWSTCPGRPRRRLGRERGTRGCGGPPGLPGGQDRPPMCVKRADEPSSFIFGVILRLEWKSMASTSLRSGHPGSSPGDSNTTVPDRDWWWSAMMRDLQLN